MDTASIILSVLFGVVGMGYFSYGKRQQKLSAVAAGATLCVYPYFIDNVYLIVIIGGALIAAPFFIEY